MYHEQLQEDLRCEARMDYELAQRELLHDQYLDWLGFYNETEDNFPFDLWIKDLTY